jgi:hypothetical protein
VHDDPPRFLVVFDAQVVQPCIGQVRFVVPQCDQLLVHPPQSAVLTVVDFVPVELGPFEGRWVLRVGNLVGLPTVLGELTLAALGGRHGQVRFRVGAEELERRR